MKYIKVLLSAVIINSLLYTGILYAADVNLSLDNNTTIAGASIQIPESALAPRMEKRTRSFGRGTYTHTVTSTYWPNGNLKQKSRITEIYDKDGLLIRKISRIFMYDLSGRLISPVRRYIQLNTYNRDNLLVTERSYNYAYDAQYRRISSHRIIISYTYTHAGELATKTNRSFFYDATRRLVSLSINNFTYAYNSDGTLEEETYEYSAYDAEGNRTAFAYTVTEHSYYDNGDTYSISSSFDSNGILNNTHETTSTYYEDGTLSEIITIQKYYNEDGTLNRKEYIRYAYDENGEPTAFNHGITTAYVYDENGTLIGKHFDANNYVYDASGNQILQYAYTMDFVSDGNGGLVNSRYVSSSYDSSGNLYSTHETTFIYNENGILIWRRHEGKRYDENGRIIEETSEWWSYDQTTGDLNHSHKKTTTYVYNEDDSLKEKREIIEDYEGDGSIIASWDIIESMEYWSNGNLQTKTRHYEHYGSDGLLVRKTMETRTYDSSEGQAATEYSFYEDNLLKQRISTSYWRDAQGDPLRGQHGYPLKSLVSSVYNKYNAEGLISEEKLISTVYYESGRPKSLTITTTTYTYDPNGTLIDTNQVTSGYDYDQNGNITKRGIVEISDHYDESGRLLEKVEKHNFNDDSGNHSWSTIETRNYTYNVDDSLNTVTNSWSSQNADSSLIASSTGLSTYYYNGDNSLREIVKESHSYDGLGNPLESIAATTRYAYNGNGLITEIQYETYYYDAEGSLVSSTLEVKKYDDNEMLTDWRIYFYDADGNLIEVRIYDEDGNAVLQSREIREKADLNNDGELTKEELMEYEAAVQALIPTIQVTEENKRYDVDGDGRILNRDLGCLNSVKDILLDDEELNPGIHNTATSDLYINVTGDMALDSDKAWDLDTIVINVTGALGIVPSASGYDIYVNGDMLIESDATIDLSAYSIYVDGNLTIRSEESVILSPNLSIVVTGAADIQAGSIDMQVNPEITVEGGGEPVVNNATISGDQEVIARLETQEESSATRDKGEFTYYNDLKPRKSKYLDWLKY